MIDNQQSSTQYLPPSFRKEAPAHSPPSPPPRPPGPGKRGPDSASPFILLLPRPHTPHPPPRRRPESLSRSPHAMLDPRTLCYANTSKTRARLPATPSVGRQSATPTGEHGKACISGKTLSNFSDFLFHHL